MPSESPAVDTAAARSATSAPAFEGDRTTNQLVVPIVAGALHENAMPVAAQLAEAWDLPVQLVHVSPSISSTDTDLDAVLTGVQSWYPTIEVTAKHLYGDDPAKAIADHVGPRALLVVATEHIDAWSFKDSVGEALINAVGLPVLLVGPHVTKTGLRHRKLDGEIVVGVDGSAAAEAGVAPAAALARSLHRPLWLVRIVSKPVEGETVFHPEIGRYMQALAEAYDGEIACRWEVIQSNDPVRAIETFAARRDAGFVVASTRGRADTTRHSMASIATGLAATAERPVLVLRAAEVPTIDAG